VAYSSIEAGNERFVVEKDMLIHIAGHQLIRAFSRSPEVEIIKRIEVVVLPCFERCKSMSLLSFESNSRSTRGKSRAVSPSSLHSIVSLFHLFHLNDIQVNRIESEAFAYSSLQSIEIPPNVEILGSSRCYKCGSISSSSFESN
jgi:hypothetical protein